MYAVSMWLHTCKWSHVRTYKLKKNTTKQYLFIHILFIHLYGIWAKRHKTFRTLACESAPLCLFYRMFVKCVSRINALYNLHSTASLLVSASVCVFVVACIVFAIPCFVRGHCFIHQIERHRQIRISVTIFVNKIWKNQIYSHTQTHTRGKIKYDLFSCPLLHAI